MGREIGRMQGWQRLKGMHHQRWIVRRRSNAMLAVMRADVEPYA
jgi:hypothetical protein